MKISIKLLGMAGVATITLSLVIAGLSPSATAQDDPTPNPNQITVSDLMNAPGRDAEPGLREQPRPITGSAQREVNPASPMVSTYARAQSTGQSVSNALVRSILHTWYSLLS